jgi:hypothetical protein
MQLRGGARRRVKFLACRAAFEWWYRRCAGIEKKIKLEDFFMNATNAPIASVEAAKREFAEQITALEKKAFEAGRASASSFAPGVARAERMAAKALALQAANPTWSNLQAVKAAYESEGEKIE